MSPDFYRALYDEEWQRRDQIQSATATPVGILTLLGGALVYLATAFRTQSVFASIAFWTTFAGALIGFVAATYMLLRSLTGYTYRRIPFPSKILEYETQLKAHLASINRPQDEKPKLHQFLIASYVEATDRNSLNNLLRSEYLYKATRALTISLVFAAFTALPYIVEARQLDSPTTSSRVNNGK
jgi:hypothetical protein